MLLLRQIESAIKPSQAVFYGLTRIAQFGRNFGIPQTFGQQIEYLYLMTR
jgi:hypothetical protein